MIPRPYNEPVNSFAPNSEERKLLKLSLQKLKQKSIELPMNIGGEWISTNKKIKVIAPHQHSLVLGYINEGTKNHIAQAIQAAQLAKPTWAKYTIEQRAAVLLKAADLISTKYRFELNAATMLGQSKNAYQAEIDAVCELADFLRFNAKYAEQIYNIQPNSAHETWNRMEYRPLEGFVYALSPFNFTAIAGNLCMAPIMMGNTVIWKPSYTQAYSANLLMEIWIEAGLPAGVINLVYADGIEVADVIIKHADFAGLHFTGSTQVFQSIWKKIGENIHTYKNYPRIVGETGGKDFIVAHESASIKALVTAMIRGAFEYQGQKCSAASRAYISDKIWIEVKQLLLEELSKIKIGSVEDFENFVNAVIDEKSFDRLAGIIEEAKLNPEIEILFGGTYDKREGYFIQPTVFVTSNPQGDCIKTEYFGPILSIYIYPNSAYSETLELINQSSSYALTGAVFARDRAAIVEAENILINAAGNFYINDKPTGAVVDQQPFGGARASGTNDKAGSILNLLRWVSPRTIKENFNSPTEFTYPFMAEEK